MMALGGWRNKSSVKLWCRSARTSRASCAWDGIRMTGDDRYSSSGARRQSRTFLGLQANLWGVMLASFCKIRFPALRAGWQAVCTARTAPGPPAVPTALHQGKWPSARAMPPWSRTNAALLSILFTVVDNYERPLGGVSLALALLQIEQPADQLRRFLGWSKLFCHTH